MRIDDQQGNPASLLVNVIRSLEKAGRILELDDAQVQDKLDQLLSAYPGEWSIFFLTGASSAITAAITTDTTLPWLDTNVAGVTLRQRILNRLS